MDKINEILGLRQYLLNYANSISSNRYYNEDAVQEATIKAVRKINTFNGKSSLKRWMCTITRNVIIDFARKNRLDAREELVEHAVEESSNSRDLEHEALHEVDNLDEDSKDVVVMSSLLGLTTRQISFVKGFSIGKVNYVAHNGFNALKAKLNRK